MPSEPPAEQLQEAMEAFVVEDFDGEPPVRHGPASSYYHLVHALDLLVARFAIWKLPP